MTETDPRQTQPGEADLETPPLGALRLGRPDPALRQRTLRAVGTALAATPQRAFQWRAWRVEVALAGAIAICASLLPAFDGLPAELRPPPVGSVPADGLDATTELLELDDLEPYIRVRRALARRNPHPEPRYPTHAFASRTLPDVY